MHTFLDSKTMAKALRKALAERQIEVSHADSLELVARQFGLNDWNTLAARIEAARPRKLPRGWHIHQGAGYPLFEMGIDPNDPGSVTIVAISSPDVVGHNFATLMQSISAEDYRGQTLKLTAELRGDDVGYGCLWMRVDAQGGGKSLRFDNMLMRDKDGAISGRFGWTERSIVLDVPDEAGTLHYGPMLKGAGQLWARNLRIDPVSTTTRTTDSSNYPRRPTGFGEAP
jgi:hypothetical protein